MNAAVALLAVALPVGLVCAAGHVSSSELGLPSQVLQLVAPASHASAAPKHAVVARHATAWPTQHRRPHALTQPGRWSADRVSTATVTSGALVRRVPAPESPGVALAQPAVQPRPAEQAPGPEVLGSLPSVTTPRLPSASPAPAPSAPPVAEAATAVPSSAPVPAPLSAPVATAPLAPSSPVVAKPQHHDEHEEGGGD